MSTERYLQCQIELSEPLPALTVPADSCGLAAVLRLRDRPVGFFMIPSPPGSVFSAGQIGALVLGNAGEPVLAAKIAAELTSPPPPVRPPSVDIVICTHDRPLQVARLLETVTAIPGAGVLVIDNAPSSGCTRDVVARFPRVRYLREPKPGLDFARNRAIAESAADWLAYLDDDVVVDRAWWPSLLEAIAGNADAAAITGPILPLELSTRAQILFEQMGGFGRGFDRIRFGAVLPGVATYPTGAGMFGAGANMAFRRGALVELGGFDEALDTGAPLPGGGDLDMFYRIVRSGRILVREPGFVVYHEHRRGYRQLRRQLWTWGTGSMAFITKSWRADPAERPKIRRWLMWWLSYQFSKLVPFVRRNRQPWPWDLVFAEIAGGVAGLLGAYDRSLTRTEEIRRRFS